MYTEITNYIYVSALFKSFNIHNTFFLVGVGESVVQGEKLKNGMLSIFHSSIATACITLN